MSNRPTTIPPPHRDPTQSETEIGETARTSLIRTRQALAELQAAMAPLIRLGRPLQQMCSSLSDLTIATAGGVAQVGPAGRPLLPVVEQLAELARCSAVAVRELETGMSLWQRKLEALVELSEFAQREIEPMLSQLNQPVQPARAAEPTPERAEPPPTPAAARAAMPPRPATSSGASVFEVWPAGPKADRLKN
jgi:hypothetical protein